ncbi:MAG: PEP-CTERM sorting domain-containing protein [Pseudomonadota bacterium]
MKHTLSSFAAVALVTAFSIAKAAAVIIVPGISDPWLAGMPDGSTASGADVAPTHSPVFATAVTGGDVLTFEVTGAVSFTPSCCPASLTPDGNPGTGSHFAGAENGISNVLAPFNSMIGVFLSDAQPDAMPAPDTLDFSPGGLTLDFLTLSPELQQAFFIGDGKTSADVVQQFTAPTGATRLFLGTMDGFGWFNNSGEFQVTINGATTGPGPDPDPVGVSEPAPLGLLLLASLGILALRRKK